VKVTIMFRGREMTHTELGRKILDRLVGDLGEMVTVESMPKQEGRNMIMVISPNKRHLEQLARAQARQPEPLVEPPEEPASMLEASSEPQPEMVPDAVVVDPETDEG
jgi:translation initiation factor IF-3